MNTIECLEAFRDLKITKEELLKKLKVTSLDKLNEVVMISSVHVIQMLISFKAGEINEYRLLEWVNTIWFTDVFNYIDAEEDCIASVMTQLEEIDEGAGLDKTKVDFFIKMLELKKPIS